MTLCWIDATQIVRPFWLLHAYKSLILLVPPTIKDADGQKDFTVIQGNSIKLPCEVSGDPRPIVTWTKNSNRLSITDPHYFINEEGSLEIFSADPQDTATYTCTAINVAAIVEKTMTLFVEGNYVFLHMLCHLYLHRHQRGGHCGKDNDALRGG